MLGKQPSIWLIRFGVVLTHVVLFIVLTRPYSQPEFPEAPKENPVFVVLVPPPPPENVKDQKTKPSKPKLALTSAPKSKPPTPDTPLSSPPVPTAPPMTSTEVQSQKKGGAELVFIPEGNRQSGTALGKFFKSWSCTKLDGQGRPINCEKRKVDLMQGYEDEIKRIAQKADGLLYLNAGSPKLRPPADVSLINRDPMATISTTGAPGIVMERSKQLENLHKYKDPAFGD